MESAHSQVILYVNGNKHVVGNANPGDTLLTFLRDYCHLKGTKLGCAEGGCGACTVMVSEWDKTSGEISHYTVNSCLARLVAMHGKAITTVEGIGSTKTRLHAVQKKLAQSHGSQCGFCTPGIVMSMYTLLRNYPQPSEEQMMSALEGNLCRCTGYRPILEGFREFTRSPCSMGEKCCKMGGSGRGAEANEEETTTYVYDSSQEPIFPPELKLGSFNNEYKHYQGDDIDWYRPVDLQALLELKKQFPSARLVCGNTEVGVEVKFKNQHYPVIIAPTHIAELKTVDIVESGVWFGASVTLTRLDEVLQKQIDSLPEHTTRIYSEIVEMLRWFAGRQIRNVSSLAGNLMTASPISDLNPLYLAAGVKIKVMSADRGVREITLDGNFFISYRKIAVESDEILLSIHIPRTSEEEFFAGYKQAHRKEDDIAIVNAGMRVRMDKTLSQVEEISLAYGGMAPITKTCPKTANTLKGREWNEELLDQAIQYLKEDLPLADEAPGGMIDYRKTLTISFFYKFYETVKYKVAKMQKSGDAASPDFSVVQKMDRGPTKGIQMYQEDTENQSACWKAIPTLSAELQCTGEAQYVDDMPTYKDELYIALVISTKAHAKVLSVDATEALQCGGVKDFISAKDIPGSNKTGVCGDDLIFATEGVTCAGQVIGAVIADNQKHAQAAAKKVKIEYKELSALLTIQDAIEANSFHGERSLDKGDVDAGFLQSEHILSGEIKMGGQEHFYLETNAVICIPRDHGEMELFASTQDPSQVQFATAAALGVPSNRIHVRTKRLGGGFGGKESRSIVLALPAAIASRKHEVPVRCMLNRDEDMIITGGRHPYLAKYKVGFNSDGRIIAFDAKLYSNGGNTLDLTMAVLEQALTSIDNSYNIPNFRVQGWACKTNIPSNTAFRGFGAPQGMFIIEQAMSEVATKLDLEDSRLRAMHLYKEGDLTHYKQPIIDCNITKCWEQVLQQSDYVKRKEEVDKYNSQSRYRKKGICAVPNKLGMSFGIAFLNQGAALVHIYKDGNVLLTHGGVEMGQGLFTKMIQVASNALSIPAEKIHTMEVSTSTVANTSSTAASFSSDLNGGAILNACNELNKRLKPFKEAKPDGTWEEWISSAYFSRVSLSSTGYYAAPELSIDFSTSTGTPYSYYSFGAAVSEVEIDCLTGDHQILRTDIVMDVGKSLNPAIDVGQIEGGFVQGYGLFCLEQVKLMSSTGRMITTGPGNYKIPGFANIPQDFNVTLLKDAPNVKAVYSSKGIGEPPLFLSASVFFAIKSAIKAARVAAGRDVTFRLDSPCTPERIRMACADSLTDQFVQTEYTGIPKSSFFVEP